MSAPDRELEGLLERSLDCVHCGLCLPTCPTYRETGRENSSPRGRIYLMRGAAEGRIPFGDLLAEEAHLCLGCRACETACPSGVQFGAMLERTRAEVERRRLRRGPKRTLERIALRHVVARPARLRTLMRLLRAVQRTGVVERLRRRVPASLRPALDLLPTVPPARERERLPLHFSAIGPARGRVALFEGCVMPELFGRVNRATARVLARNGFEVVVPALQGCCGALHAHAGDEPFAHELARENLRAFADVDVEAIVVNSAGCGAAMKESHHWLPGEAYPFASRVVDVCEWLEAQGLRAPEGRFEARVCYDDPCHLLHAQGIGDAPRKLLGQVSGLELVSHRDAAACCGAAGTYNLTQPEMSRAVLERKLDALAEADPDVIATGNPGCHMQLEQGARARGLRARVMHPVEILDAAYGGGDQR